MSHYESEYRFRSPFDEEEDLIWADERKRLTEQDRKASVYAAIGNAGQALLANALDPTYSGIGKAMGAFQDTMTSETDRRAKLMRDIEDRVLERERMRLMMEHAKREDSRAEGRYGHEQGEWERADTARAITHGAIQGVPNAPAFSRQMAEAAAMVDDQGRAASLLGPYATFDTDLGMDVKRAEALGGVENDLRLGYEGERIKRGWEVPEREQFNSSNFRSDRSYDLSKDRFDLDSRLDASRDFSDNLARVELRATQDAHKQAAAQLKNSMDPLQRMLAEDLDNPDSSIQEAARQSKVYRAAFDAAYQENIKPFMGGLSALASEYGSHFGESWLRRNVPQQWRKEFGVSEDGQSSPNGVQLPADLGGRVGELDPNNEFGLAEEVAGLSGQGFTPPPGLDSTLSYEDVKAYADFRPHDAAEAKMLRDYKAKGIPYRQFELDLSYSRGMSK